MTPPPDAPGAVGFAALLDDFGAELASGCHADDWSDRAIELHAACLAYVSDLAAENARLEKLLAANDLTTMGLLSLKEKGYAEQLPNGNWRLTDEGRAVMEEFKP